MSEHEVEAPDVRRILVALDASPYSMAALHEAVRLAAALSAELVGLFVEDVNLLRWAELPFTRFVRYPAEEDADIDRSVMEGHLQRRALQARRALERAAAEAEVSWTFRIVRGQVTAELMQAALEADLVALGRASYPRPRRLRLGSTARAMVAQAPHVVWLPAREGPEPYAPLFVTYDGSELGRQGLLLAETIADDRPLYCVLIDAGERLEALEAEVREYVGPVRARRLTFRQLPAFDTESLARIVNMEKGVGLVIAGDLPPLDAGELETLLDELDCAVVIVR